MKAFFKITELRTETNSEYGDCVVAHVQEIIGGSVENLPLFGPELCIAPQMRLPGFNWRIGDVVIIEPRLAESKDYVSLTPVQTDHRMDVGPDRRKKG